MLDDRWMLRLVQTARARASLALWGMVVLLVGAIALGDGSVRAQKVAPTDTTTVAGGSDSSTRDHTSGGAAAQLFSR